jgi:D-3-phosphoglycerate dehydrogenase / 2-oxoglutarate reductase
MTFVAVRLNALSYPVEGAEERELKEADARLIAVEGQKPEEIIAAAEKCDALLVVSSSVPAGVIRRLNRCRVISRLGAGTDKIDIEEATRQGIVVANVPDFCTNEQAEHAFALLLAWTRRLPFMLGAMRQGQWTARNHPGVHRLAGQTLGLLGFGASAQAVARRGGAFGMRVIAWARIPQKYTAAAQSLGVELATLEQTLAESDFLSIHLPLVPETRGLVDAARIGAMKPSAVLINTARGAIVDEAALVSALREGRISGAALDVFDGIDVFALPGDAPRHPLLDLENVLLTPHCAGSSVESAVESKTRGARHAADVLNGRWPPHVVNPGVIPRHPLRSGPAL